MLAVPQYDGGLFEGGADAATIEDIVRWGTAGGAKVLGLDQIGTIEVGQQADFVLYQLDDPRYFGLHDIAIGPIASGGRAHIKAMFIAGKMVVQEDQIPDVDMKELAWQARQAVQLLQQRTLQVA